MSEESEPPRDVPLGFAMAYAASRALFKPKADPGPELVPINRASFMGRYIAISREGWVTFFPCGACSVRGEFNPEPCPVHDPEEYRRTQQRMEVEGLPFMTVGPKASGADIELLGIASTGIYDVDNSKSSPQGRDRTERAAANHERSERSSNSGEY